MDLRKRFSFILILLFLSPFQLPLSHANESASSGYDPVVYENISFSAYLNDQGQVVTSWGSYGHTEPFSFYKLIRSQTNPDPVYPDDGYIYFTTQPDELSYTDSEVPTGTSYYRICQIAGSKRYCSTTVIAIAKGVGNTNQNAYFTDIQGHWAENYIITLAEHCRQLQGYHVIPDRPNAGSTPDRTFRPNNTATRAEVVAMLGKCLELSFPVNNVFPDVQDFQWYQGYVNMAAKRGWVQGDSDGLFHPNRPVTRAEALKILITSQWTVAEGNLLDSRPVFADVPENSWYFPFVAVAYKKGYVQGYSAGGRKLFYPSRSITRAEVAKIIVKVFGWDAPLNENTNTTVPTNSNSSTTANTNSSLSVSGVPLIGGCSVFPASNAWNQDVSTLPVHANSENFIASIGASTNLHADFGGNGAYGIPYVVVPADQTKLPINFTAYGDESDAGPYPVPANAPIEGGSDSDGDRHVLVVQSGACKLYELYRAFYNGHGWDADAGVIFDLTSNALRPEGWTSADAAGLPILPGLARYDEVAAGVINHALRFTVSKTQKGYIHPATHYASSSTNANLPPMGLRVRLKSSFDVSYFTGQAKIILTALKKYGMIVADNGSNWYITGASDTRWDDEDLNQLKTVPGSSFEVVDTGPIVN